MNTLVIVLIAVVVLGAGYVFYGRHIAKKWGVDPKAETPAVKYNDGEDYVPTNGWTVFSHQFSSIAGAGPVTGAIQAAVFGWLPVLRLKTRASRWVCLMKSISVKRAESFSYFSAGYSRFLLSQYLPIWFQAHLLLLTP